MRESREWILLTPDYNRSRLERRVSIYISKAGGRARCNAADSAPALLSLLSLSLLVAVPPMVREALSVGRVGEIQWRSGLVSSSRMNPVGEVRKSPVGSIKVANMKM